jgi:hypothetical protein
MRNQKDVIMTGYAVLNCRTPVPIMVAATVIKKIISSLAFRKINAYNLIIYSFNFFSLPVWQRMYAEDKIGFPILASKYSLGCQ